MTSVRDDAAAPTPALGSDAVITLRGVKKHFPVREGVFQHVVGHIRAVDGVSFEILRGKTIGLVGESGCGKTTLGRCIARLTDATGGGIYFRLPEDDRRFLDEMDAVPESLRTPAQTERIDAIERSHNIDRLKGAEWQTYRRNCQFVFQDAFSSLNPRPVTRSMTPPLAPAAS